MALAGIVVGMLTAPASALPPTCRVINVTQGTHFPPDSGQALISAIAAAMPGEPADHCRGLHGDLLGGQGPHPDRDLQEAIPHPDP
jgi:hypothetical protein